MREEDKSLFLAEMNDVAPLKTAERALQYQQEAIKKQAKATVRDVKKRQRKQIFSPPPLESQSDSCSPPLVTSHETIIFHQKGIRLQDLAKLKKGAFNNQAQLDLHGYTRDEANSALTHFINAALQEELRYIRIVHGKGYNSEEAFPVLKNLVNQSLRRLNSVLAFCSTPEKDGGAGAVNLFLKKR